VEVGFQAVKGTEAHGTFDTSLEDGVVVAPAPAFFADAPPGKHSVVGANALQIVQRLHNGDAPSSQHGEDRWRNLVADVVQVRDVRLLLFYEGVDLSGSLEGVEETCAELHFLPERNIGAIVIDLLYEKGRLLTRVVSGVSGGKDDDGVPFLSEELFQEEETGLRSPQRKIELIDQQNLQTLMLLGSWIPLPFPWSLSLGSSGRVHGGLVLRFLNSVTYSLDGITPPKAGTL